MATRTGKLGVSQTDVSPKKIQIQKQPRRYLTMAGRVGVARSDVIGLYRDVWIAAIASSRKSLATQTAAICVRFHGRRVRHVYVTMQITFLARKSALIYRRGLRQRVASLTIDCNGVSAIRAYRPTATPHQSYNFPREHFETLFVVGTGRYANGCPPKFPLYTNHMMGHTLGCITPTVICVHVQKSNS